MDNFIAPVSEHKYPSKDELLEIPKESYACHICQHKVRTKSNLRAHFIKKHKIIEDENDYAFFTKQKSNIKTFYHCPIDGCKYNNKDNGFVRYFGLKQHYLWVHGEKPYLCNTCKRTFPTATNFRNHSAQCGQLFYCNQCSKSFRSKSSLFTHQRCHHAGRSPSNAKQLLPSTTQKSADSLLTNSDLKWDPCGDNKSVVDLTNYGHRIVESSPLQTNNPLCVPMLLQSNSNNCNPPPPPHNSSQSASSPSADSSIKPVTALVVSLCHYLTTVTNNQNVIQQALRLQDAINSIYESSPPHANHSSYYDNHSAINLSTHHHSLDASINVVPHLIGAGIQSCAPTIESSIQTDDSWEAFIRSNTYACSMPSVAVSTDLSLGLDESAVIQSILNGDDSAYRRGPPAVSSYQHYSTGCGPSTPPYLSSTAMQTDKPEMFYPSTHVETQTWKDLCKDFGFQDLTDIETQTVDIDELLATV